MACASICRFLRLFESRTFLRIGCEECAGAEDARALGQQELAQFRREKRAAVRAWIEIEQEPAAGFEHLGPNIIDKEFPIARSPFVPSPIRFTRCAVKTNAVAGNEVELLAEIWQRDVGLNAGDGALNPKVADDGAKERVVSGIKTDPAMAEEPADIEEIAGAAAKIENTQWRCAVEPKILRPLGVDIDPSADIIPGVDSARTGPARINLTNPSDLIAIDCREDPAGIDRVSRSCGMFPHAGQGIGRNEFLDFLSQAHSQSCYEKGQATNASRCS